MPKERISNPRRAYSWTVNLLSNNNFLYGVVGLSIIQGLWYALTFKPNIFDESQHLGFIKLYSNHLSPFIAKQLPSMDFLGEVTRSPSYLYYYLMSWPQRLINLLTTSTSTQIICLRIINIGLYTGGLLIYRQLLLKTRLPKALIHLVLFFLILTPSIAIMSGSVNYDNAIFLLSGLILLLALKLINLRQVNFLDLSVLFIVGMLAALVKFELLALVIPVLIYVAYQLKQNNSFKKDLFVKSFFKLSLATKIIIVGLLILSIGLFIERPIINLIKYHEINPSCTKIIGLTRCKNNYTELRNISALQSKPVNFSPANPFSYLLEAWLPGMIVTQVIIPPTQISSLLLRLLYYGAGLGGIFVIILYLRDFLKDKAFKLLLVTMFFYVLILSAYNYLAYVHLGMVVAVTGRYLLPILPIFMAFSLLGLVRLMSRLNRVFIVLGLIVVLLIFTQGGGVTTYLLATDKSYYWSNDKVLSVNIKLQKAFRPLIKLRGNVSGPLLNSSQ